MSNGHGMRVHYYKQFFSGPDAPGSQQPRKLVRALAERGHEVEVVACDVNAYNEQHEPEESLNLAGGGRIRVHRLRGRRGIRASLGARLRAYLGFALPALRLGRSLSAPDMCIASIQPLFTAWSARAVAYRHRVPWLLEVRDLWPDALEAKGAVRRWQAWPLQRLASSLYRSADRVVSITPGIKVELVRKGLRGDRVDVLPNGFDPELFNVSPGTRVAERERLGWGGTFVALFAGTHTEVTAVETIVRAADYLRGRADIRFDLFGYGQRKPAAQALAKDLGLANVHFHDPVPKSRVPSLIAAADVCLMTLFESPLIHIYFENKLMDYMGAGKPILAAMGGQQAELLKRTGAGRVVPAFDHQGLARLVADAAGDPEGTKALGAAGRRAVEQGLMLPDILDRYVEVVEAVAAGRGHSLPAWEPKL
ncbi:MAG: glycosyltransferase family 4 protein [Thermoanaerobaculaceae bacterium]